MMKKKIYLVDLDMLWIYGAKTFPYAGGMFNGQVDILYESIKEMEGKFSGKRFSSARTNLHKLCQEVSKDSQDYLLVQMIMEDLSK